MVTPSIYIVVSIYSQVVPLMARVLPNSEYLVPKSLFGVSANAVKFPRGPEITEMLVSSTVFEGL